MMQKNDELFVSQVKDSQSREKTIHRWRRSRMASLVAFGCCFLAAIFSLAGDNAALCGLFSGIAAINFTVAVSTDLMIKFALLASEMQKA